MNVGNCHESQKFTTTQLDRQISFKEKKTIVDCTTERIDITLNFLEYTIKKLAFYRKWQNQ